MMRRCVLVAMALAAAVVQAQPWGELGPAPIDNVQYSGRVSAVACSPSDSSLYYVGGADGGVWRTEDAGASWTPLTDDMPTTAIGAIAIDPTDESVLYVGTGEPNYANHSRYGLGLYKSLDGGESWTHLAEDVFGGRCFTRILVHPSNPSVLYASITRAGGFPELAAAKGHPDATGPLGVFKSIDAGQTWSRLTALPNLSASDLAMDPGDPDVLYAAIGRIFGSPENGIYTSLNGGATWTKLAGGLPSSDVGRISLAIAPSDSSRVYALVARESNSTGGNASTLGAYRSDNSGVSWTTLPMGNIQASYGWYLSVVSVHPTDPDTVFMGGVSLVRSTNGGSSWDTVTPPHVDLHALAWDASGRLVAGDDGGLHRSGDLGSEWEPLNTGLGSIQFYAGLSLHPTDDMIMMGGTQDNGTNLRRSASGEWDMVFGGDGGWTLIHPNDPAVLFCEFQGSGRLYKSGNGGDSFHLTGNGISRSDRVAFLPPYSFVPGDNPSRMLYATHRVYLSTDTGTSWTAISPDVTGGSGAIRALAIAPSDADIVYVATTNGRVLRSEDGGESFDLLLTDAEGWPRVTRELCVDPDDADTVYLAGARFGVSQVRRSVDGGETWQVLDGDLPDIPVNVLGLDSRKAERVLYAGTDAGVYRSADDGGTWQLVGCGLPTAPVIDLHVEGERERIVIATQGRGVWAAPLDNVADFNDDGRVNTSDVIEYLNAFVSKDPAADLAEPYGVLNTADFLAYLNLFVAGCP